MDKVIRIKEGFGDIRFNMPVEEVVTILGQPTEVESIDNAADEATTVLRYNDELTLFFEGEEPVLSCIDICDEEVTLFGQKIFNLGEQELVKLMVDNNLLEQDVENEDWGERRVSFIQANLDFFLEEDELLSVNIGK